MDAQHRLAEGDRVKVIDNESKYFGKTGKLIKIIDKSVSIIDRSSQEVSSETEFFFFVVKMEGSGITETFTSEQIDKRD